MSGNSILAKLKNSANRPAIVGGNSKVEHFEVATYRGLIQGAQAMGQTEVASLLQENLAQEENTADMLEASMPELLQRAMQTESSQAASS